MARITTVNRAQKDQGECYRISCDHQIVKGERYYWVSLKTGPASSTRRAFCLQHYPHLSETTASDKLSQLYAAREYVEEMLDDFAKNEADREAIIAALEDAAESAEQVGGEYGDAADAVDEHFPGSYRVDELREKAEACEQWTAILQSAAAEIEGVEDPQEIDNQARQAIEYLEL